VNGVQYLHGAQFWASAAEVAEARSFVGSLIVRNITQLPAATPLQALEFRPEPIGTFDQSCPLTPDGTVRVIPTPGHTKGHVSVIAQTPEYDYFIAGDVTYDAAAILQQAQQGLCADLPAHTDTLRRTLGYLRQRPTVYLPSHDPQSSTRLAQHQVTR
jgi:glyoxylase-like metal-dependent hydrolase (beta-lactamase superfamily II)